jgi:septation ring formation regulator EzrA
MNNQWGNLNQNNNCNVEKSLDESKIREMEEDLELLREQVESLKQLLRHENEVTNYYIEELAQTKQELEWMNQELNNLVALNTQLVDEAEEFAHSRVENKKSVSESVAELGSGIDGSLLKVNDSKLIDGSSVRSKSDNLVAQSHKIKAQSHKIMARSSQIASKLENITARSRELRVGSCEIKVHSRELRNQLREATVSPDASNNPALSPTGTARGRS